MMTAIVKFDLGAPMAPADFLARFEPSVPAYQGLPGLIRKYYLRGEDGVVGGVYLWESRAAAEAFYTEAWRAGVAGRIGVAPSVEYYDSPIVIDNALDETLIAAE